MLKSGAAGGGAGAAGGGTNVGEGRMRGAHLVYPLSTYRHRMRCNEHG